MRLTAAADVPRPADEQHAHVIPPRETGPRARSYPRSIHSPRAPGARGASPSRLAKTRELATLANSPLRLTRRSGVEKRHTPNRNNSSEDPRRVRPDAPPHDGGIAMSTPRHRLLTALCLSRSWPVPVEPNRTRAGSAGASGRPASTASRWRRERVLAYEAFLRDVTGRSTRPGPTPASPEWFGVGAGGGAGGLLGAVRLPAGLYVQGQPPGGGHERSAERGLEAGGAEPYRGATGREARARSSSSSAWTSGTRSRTWARSGRRGAIPEVQPLEREDRPVRGVPPSTRGPTGSRSWRPG